MTVKVKDFLKFHNISTWDMSDSEYNNYSIQFKKMRAALNAAELESLKPYISAREFSLAIKPLIEAKLRNSP